MPNKSRQLLLLFFILIGFADLVAQDSTYVTLKSGNKLGDVLSTTDIYYYPEFTKGELFYKGGTKGTAKMNYNRVFDQMLFINPKGDTLAMAEEETIKFIVIDKDTFYYDEGFVRVVASNSYVKLGEKKTWTIVDLRKTGALGTSSNTTGISSVKYFRDGNNDMARNDLTLNEDIVLRKETQYFIGNENNNFTRAGKKKIQQLFPKDQRSIDNYLKENKLDLNKKDDLEKLYQFLSHLH